MYSNLLINICIHYIYFNRKFKIEYSHGDYQYSLLQLYNSIFTVIPILPSLVGELADF